jgi:hypothetical protein
MAAGATAGRTAAPARLGFLGLPLVALLSVEFLLGMGLNLFVTLPGGAPLAILASSPTLVAHVIVAVLLLGLAANILRTALRDGQRRDVLVASLGLLSGAVAFGAGLSFTFAGGSDGVSYAMSAGFLGMVLEAAYFLRSFPSSTDVPAASARSGAGG